MRTRIAADNILPADPMDISEDERMASTTENEANGAGSDREGSVLSDPPDHAQAPKPSGEQANGSTARSLSSSTAREEGTPAVESTGGRRKSGRVIRKPKKLQEEIIPPSSTKRKRAAQVDPEELRDASEESNGEEAGGGDGEEAEDEDEDGDEGEEDEEESEAEDDGPDEEELREKKRSAKKKGPVGKKAVPAKAPAAKKARTASGAVATSAAPAKRGRKPAGTNGAALKPAAGRKGKGKGRAREKHEGDADSYLFDAVMDADNLNTVANDWTIKYEEDSLEAMRQLVNFFLRCCGCEQSVTTYDIEDQDTAAATLSQIQEVFQKQQSPDYPIISKRTEFRGFRKTLSDFLNSLIAHVAAKELLYTDPALIENIQVWITAMSSSTLRPFRHTSTIISFNILTTLCDTAAELRKANVIATRQLEAENNKGKKNQGRIKALEAKLKEGEERRDAVEGVIKDIFDAVFVHRYRDIDPKIRADCVHDLATWILKLPDLFFDGTYLRYLGWVLSDMSALTRLEVIKSLSRIFKNKDNISGMRNFTERFRPRLVEMATRDADSSVRALTVELLDVVREVGFLEPSDVDTVGRLLFDSDARVRKAVVGFFVKNIEDLYEEKIEDLGGQEAVDEGMAGVDDSDEDYAGPRVSWIKLKCLVEVLASYDEGSEDGGESGAESQGVTGGGDKLGTIVREGAVESRFSLAGTALWESFPEVQDWEGIARYLLYDHSASQVDGGEDNMEELIKRTCALDAKEEVILLQVLNASVAASILAGEGAQATQAAKKASSKKKKPDGNSQEYVSRSLATLIPPLLRKFGPVPDAASTVLRLEQLMKLDVYTDLRQSAAYASLLDDINRQFLTHADESVLKEASAALLHAKTFEELDDVTGEKLGQLQEETVAMLVACVRGKDVKTARFGDGVLTELINTVRRLEYLGSITDCREVLETPATATITSKRKGKQAASETKQGDSNGKQVLPIDILLALLARGTSLDELEEELILRILKVLLFFFMWKVKALSEEDPKDIADIDVDDLQARRQAMVLAVGKIVQSRGQRKADGMDAVRIAAAGTLLDLFTLFATLRGKLENASQLRRREQTDDAEGADGAARQEQASDGLTRLVEFSKLMPTDLQQGILKVFAFAEKKYAKAAHKSLIQASGSRESSSGEDESSSESSEQEDEGSAEQKEAESATLLMYEQRLCELAGKIVLAILGGVVDAKRFRRRVERNKTRLGASYREVVMFLESSDEEGHKGRGRPGPGKGGKSGTPAAKGKGEKKGAKSAVEIVEDEDDMEDRIVVGLRKDTEEEEGEGEQEEEEEEGEGEQGEEGGEEGEGDGEGDGEKGEETKDPANEDEDEEMVDAD